MSKKKLVLAYSGGLDTTYCAVFLSKVQDYEVHAVTVNTGAFNEEEVAQLEQRALACGVTSYVCLDVRKEYYEDCIKYLVFGNVLKKR
jgi:argininosuccinate synthase